MSEESSQEEPKVKMGLAGKLASRFVDSKLTPIIVIFSILMGVFAVVQLPREEEPQIKVPMVDIYVSMPGATAKEVENRVSIPMEELLWEVPGVEYVYSTSMPGRSQVTIRFLVGENLEDSLVKLNQKLASNYDRIPHGVSQPLIKPRTIDDVPILALTLHSANEDHFILRRVAMEVQAAIKKIPSVAETHVIGGNRREVRIQFDSQLLASRNLAMTEVAAILKVSNSETLSRDLVYNNHEVLLQTGQFFRDAEDVGNVVVGLHGDRPVYLKDVAHIIDGPEEPSNYVLHGAGGQSLEPAVTISLAKRPGTNAISVVQEVLKKVDALKGTVIPDTIEVTVTRDYGETAAEKSNELLLHMGIAVFGVSILIFFFLGWRDSVVVLIAIPSTLALTLLVFYLYGYTLNRITLFALIFSIGILVDDAIVVVENITRHNHLPQNRKKSLLQIAIGAVDEVGNPTILATWAVIGAIVPMAFVGGLMGPYMRPIPIGASAAMFFSLIIAFVVTPWAAIRILKLKQDGGSAHGDPDEVPTDIFTRAYHRVMDPLINKPSVRWVFLFSIMVLLLASMGFVLIGWVKVKMLPFDNKSEFQLILNMPEGTTLEETTEVALEMAAELKHIDEVLDYQVYAGVAAPFNFNGLVRHYYDRQGPTVADIQVNLLPKHARSAQSHDIAKRVRPLVAAIAKKHGGRVAVAEVPPGPPVLQTLVTEVYGPDDASRLALAREVLAIYESTEGVVDVDWYVENQQPKFELIIDKEKAALHGISEAAISRTIQMAMGGVSIDLLHEESEREDVNLVVELPRSQRSRPEDLLNLKVKSEQMSGGGLVSLRELATVREGKSERYRYRKNLKPVLYVTGDVAGEAESPAYAIGAMWKRINSLRAADFGGGEGTVKMYHLNQPFEDYEPTMKLDGEWHITLEVFRDLGIAFAAVLVVIYMLMVGWFQSFITPLVIMAAIPFSLIGILPAHAMMGAFFTATSMIGFIAGAGIVVRNSIILVDFIEMRVRDGLPLDQAVVEAGAVRFRPMLLTALAVVVGAAVILADPIFQGLAIALMAGEVASLLISRMAVPVLYYMVKSR